MEFSQKVAVRWKRIVTATQARAFLPRAPFCGWYFWCFHCSRACCMWGLRRATQCTSRCCVGVGAVCSGQSNDSTPAAIWPFPLGAWLRPPASLPFESSGPHLPRGFFPRSCLSWGAHIEDDWQGQRSSLTGASHVPHPGLALKAGCLLWRQEPEQPKGTAFRVTFSFSLHPL